MNMSERTKYVTKIGVLAALSIALIFAIEFPLIPAYPFLRMDFSEVPVILGGFALGPFAAVILELVKNVVHFFIKNDGTGGIGNLANFIVGVSFCVPAAWYYLKHKTRKGAIIGLVIGTVCMVAAGALANYFVLLPLWGYTEHSAKMTFIYGGAIPFNTIKSVLLSILAIILYKPLSPILHK